MSQTIISRNTQSGLPVEIRIETEGDRRFANALVSGKSTGSGIPGKLPKRVGDFTHIVGKVAITTAEYDLIIAALRAPKTDLRSQRASLLATYQGLIEDAEAAFNHLHAQENTDAAYRAKADAEPKIAAALQAIRDFDAAHPEIVEAIKADKAETADRNRWM